MTDSSNGNGWVVWALKTTLALLQVLLVVGITWLATWSVSVADRLARVEAKIEMMRGSGGARP
jgi:hypothetical protein